MRDAQRKLYQWRGEFFRENFKTKFFDHDLPVSNWITLGLDDAHTRDVLPFQISQNFLEVMKLAASKKVLDPNQFEHFYFASDEMASYLASMKFEGDTEEDEEGLTLESLRCDCGCQNATEEEKWRKRVQGMAMEWHFMAMLNEVFLKLHLGNIFLVVKCSNGVGYGPYKISLTQIFPRRVHCNEFQTL